MGIVSLHVGGRMAIIYKAIEGRGDRVSRQNRGIFWRELGIGLVGAIVLWAAIVVLSV